MDARVEIFADFKPSKTLVSLLERLVWCLRVKIPFSCYTVHGELVGSVMFGAEEIGVETAEIALLSETQYMEGFSQFNRRRR